MKKLVLFAALAVFGFSQMKAQETNFGVKAGADFASQKVETTTFDTTSSETGFYLGVFAEIGISETFIFQPEALYVSVEDLDFISIPLMAKFGVSDSFSLLVGPSVGILLDSAPSQKSTSLGIEGGAAYDISEDFFVEARYNIGVTNLAETTGFDNKISGLFVGLGYRF